MSIRVVNEVPIYEINKDNTVAGTRHANLIIESHYNDSDRVTIYSLDKDTGTESVHITVLGKDLIAAITNAQRTGSNW